jgi:TIR domain
MSSADVDRAPKSVRVFMSWSGDTSLLVAKAVCEGIELLSDRLEPWLSEDLEPGEEWASTLIPQIRKARLAVLCLTRHNVGAAWIAFETGAYYSSRAGQVVVPLLFGIAPADVEFPLGLFQGVTADANGLKRLFTRAGDLVGLEAAATEKRFESQIWPRLDGQLATIRDTAAAEIAQRAPTNIANAFFLGHDLRWTMSALSSGAEPDDVKHGITQILHQAQDLGLRDNNNFVILRQKAAEVIELPDDQWTEQVRAEVALALQLAFERLGSVLIGLQPDYNPYPPENRERWFAIQAKNRA